MTTDTKAVARWFVTTDEYGFPDTRASDTGDYVLFTDHERVVGELGKDVKDALYAADVQRIAAETLRTALAASRAEVEGLKKDAERYRWLREVYDPSIHDEGFEPLFSLGHDNLDAEIDALIDAAMEKRNV